MSMLSDPMQTELLMTATFRQNKLWTADRL